MTLHLTGIHHLTAITADVRENYRFYTDIMGMRLVKRSVNQDDVSAYHLFYADAVGTPGTDLTFFDWNIPGEKRGTHSITRTSLRVTGGPTLEYWRERLKENGVSVSDTIERDGRQVVDFEDPEGQRLSLVDDGGTGDEPTPWDRSPIPAEYQIRGLGPIFISVPRLERTEPILVDAMNMSRIREYLLPGHNGTVVYVFGMGGEGPHAELHVAVEPHLPFARQGAGGVHHVAFRTPNETEYYGWIDRLQSLGIPNSGEVDRYYFRSLYFREPNGILFEIATDGPGFAVDEDPETLGESIVLPPFLEQRREQIVENLKPIV
jgi:glyoxalase family protein